MGFCRDAQIGRLNGSNNNTEIVLDAQIGRLYYQNKIINQHEKIPK